MPPIGEKQPNTEKAPTIQTDIYIVCPNSRVPNTPFGHHHFVLRPEDNLQTSSRVRKLVVDWKNRWSRFHNELCDGENVPRHHFQIVAKYSIPSTNESGKIEEQY